MEYVSYKRVEPITLPKFELERFHNLPKLDYTDVYNPDYGTKIQNDNIYDSLLGTVSLQSNRGTRQTGKAALLTMSSPRQ